MQSTQRNTTQNTLNIVEINEVYRCYRNRLFISKIQLVLFESTFFIMLLCPFQKSALKLFANVYRSVPYSYSYTQVGTHHGKFSNEFRTP